MEGGHGDEAAFGGDPHRLLARRLEVVAVLDELGAERAHRRVLLGRIAARHEDAHREPGARAGEGEALAVVAARRRDRCLARRASRRLSASTKVSPPRTLKAPVGLWFSCLTTAAAPSRRAISGQAIAGVGGSAARTTASARSSSSRLNMTGSPAAPQTSILPFSSMTVPISTPASSPSSASSMSLCALPDGIIGKQFSFWSTRQSKITGFGVVDHLHDRRRRAWRGRSSGCRAPP